jgi:glycine cleavage system aminomethyltransferase T
VTRKLVGFELTERGLPRHGYPVWVDGKQVDIVRSGGQSPSLGKPIGTTYLPAGSAKVGTEFEVDCRGAEGQGSCSEEALLHPGKCEEVGGAADGRIGGNCV